MGICSSAARMTMRSVLRWQPTAVKNVGSEEAGTCRRRLKGGRPISESCICGPGVCRCCGFVRAGSWPGFFRRRVHSRRSLPMQGLFLVLTTGAFYIPLAFRQHRALPDPGNGLQQVCNSGGRLSEMAARTLVGFAFVPDVGYRGSVLCKPGRMDFCRLYPVFPAYFHVLKKTKKMLSEPVRTSVAWHVCMVPAEGGMTCLHGTG